MDKNYPEQKLPDKSTPGLEPPRTKTNLPVKTYVCMHVLLKLGGSEM